ncbi:MAG: hypothetical protein IJI57_05415 [Flexilinea sp.]|nr:hypothetical protein [Flexilinea sp.]
MLKVYGSDLCPDCVACKTAFDANGVIYDFVNVTESMRNLKEFLNIRDTNPVFDDARQKGYVGIPALLREDGSITLDWEAYLKENSNYVSANLKTGSACRIDGTGC